jgi:uncharacterized protein (TIGR02145 family)
VKKSLVLVLFLAIGASLFAQECRFVPGRLTDGLGLVSFVSDREWRVEGHGVVQIWSDVVQADSCSNMKEFTGSSNRQGFRFSLINCRSNPNHPGDLLTWCAVVHFAPELCPAPWRVPTAADFCNLDRILMGSGLCYSHATTLDHLKATYIDVWGGTFNGGSGSRGTLFYGGEKAYYWSITEYDEFYAFYLHYDIHGSIKSQCTENTKSLGFSLRCVRDAE